MLHRDVREHFVPLARVLVSFLPPKSDLFVHEILSEEIRERVLHSDSPFCHPFISRSAK